MRLTRIAVTFAVLMLATVVAAPRVGAFKELQNAGSTGFYTINDDDFSPGAVCRYENRPGKARDEVDKVQSRKIWTHGPFAQQTLVGHRVIVIARKNASTPWKKVWGSKLVKKPANDSEVAFFPGRTYRTPENNNRQYRVVHKLLYYKQGSNTKVIGRVRGLVEVYKHTGTQAPAPYTVGDEGGPAGTCHKKFWPVP